MCGRFTQDVSWADLAESLGTPAPAAAQEPPARWNGAPTQDFLAVRPSRDGGTEAVRLRWGIRPSWSAKPLINARAESIAAKPSFREAFRRRRCLIPATGWFEWSRTGGRSRPWWISMPERATFFLAAVWEKTDAGGRFAIVTCRAGTTLKAVHHRQPAVLGRNGRASWLDGDADPSAIAAAVDAPHPGPFEMRRLGPAANSARNDGPEILEPADDQDEPKLL